MSMNGLENDEKLRMEFLKKIQEEEKLLMSLLKEESAELMHRRKDFCRRLELERREASLNGVVLKAQEVANLQNNQIKQEEKLALELDTLRRKEIVDEKLRLQLRQTSHELKELESQLKTAYAKKAIAAQLAEKEAYKLQEKLKEKRARELIEKGIGTQKEQEMAERLIEKKQKEEFKHSLQDQIIEKEKLKQLEYITFMKEKKITDAVMQKIKEEEEKELEEKKLLQQKLKQEMEQFYAGRAMWKAKERLVLQEEEEKMNKINAIKEKQKDKANYEASVLKWIKQKASDKLLEDFKEKQKKREEEETLMLSLMQNEMEELIKRKSEEEMKVDILKRKEAQAAYKKLLEEKKKKKILERELEVEFARQTNLKIEEENKMDLAKLEKRRQQEINNLNYNKEAMKCNVMKRAESLRMTQLLNNLMEKADAEKAQLVQEERLKILREHAPKLLGYFPKGCLRNEDWEALGTPRNLSSGDTCTLEN